MKKIFTSGAVCCLILSTLVVKGQAPQNDTATQKNSIVTVANAGYNKAGKMKRVFLGQHYRKEWATPVEVEILDLDTEAGGLTPLKMGGGQQTKSLRMAGADGKEYVLRSVNKDPSKVVPQELIGTFADDIVQDQISSSNPYAPLAVAELAQAAGIFHTTPRIVFIPASARLESFSKEFANTLCLFEERPAGNQESNEAYGYSKNIVNSEKLFEKITADPDHSMNEKAFLKARLFDMWIGDWDRHEDQWLWASFKDNGKTTYQPIPRDRDQAFASLDGVIPQLASRKWAIRRTQNFDYTIRDINGLNMAGIFLDKRFTTRLTLQDWLDVTKELQKNLTDQKIEAAFHAMPKAVFEISGKEIIAKLKRRRDDLQKYAADYYAFISKEINVVGSDEAELFEITRVDNNSTNVTVYKPGNEKKRNIIYQRTFNTTETKEIRVYGLGGNDNFKVSGKVSKGILVRIMGGSGEDSLADLSHVRGWQHKTKVYGDTNYNYKSFRYDWLAPKYVGGFNPDDGVYIGGGFTFKKQQFGKAPYGYMHSIWGNYAMQTGAYNIWYKGVFTEAVGKWDLELLAQVNAPNYTVNYFGMGNETKLLKDDMDYNRVRSNQVIFSYAFVRHLGKYHTITSSSGYQSFKVEKNEDRFIMEEHAKIDSGVFARKHFTHSSLNYAFNTTDNPLYPGKGLLFNAKVEYVQNLKENDRNFVRLSSEVSSYISVGPLTGAFRTGVATNTGNDYEFYQANTLGGLSNLRGFRRDRFSGKTSVYQNTELRWRVTSMNGYILRGSWGLLAFLDNGRVWVPNEDSDTWHHGYGGGIWFLPYNKMAVTATYATSKEDNMINIKAGFLF